MIDAFDSERDLFQQDFSNGHLPDCAVPIVSWLGNASTLGRHGTGFLAQRAGKFYLLTARHCLGADNAPIEQAASRLLIPYKERNGRPVGERSWLRFERAIWSDPCAESQSSTCDPDFAILTIDVSDQRVERHLRGRAIKLPQKGMYLSALYSRLGTTIPGVPLLALGYPNVGENFIDYERNVVRRQRAVLNGTLSGPGIFPHTLNMSLSPSGALSDYNGMSGGPVMIQLRRGTQNSYLFAGMVLMGGPSVIRFLALDWLIAALNRVEGTTHPTPTDYSV